MGIPVPQKVSLSTVGMDALPFEYLCVGNLNDHMLNIVNAADRTLEFHVHEQSDELFLVLQGHMQMEFQDGIVDLAPGDLIVVPSGTLHRPVCTTPVRCLLVERIGTLNEENTGGTYQPSNK